MRLVYMGFNATAKHTMTDTSQESINGKALLKVDNLSKKFVKRLSIIQRKVRVVHALDNVSFKIEPKQTFGIVGESGCGKTTLLKCIMRVLQPTSGKIIFDGDDISALRGKALKTKRRNMQMVFQNPFVSLNPRMSILNIVSEPLRNHTKMSFEDTRQRVLTLMDQVGLEKDHIYRYPHEFSGGQLQRIAIARALSLEPKFLALDEPTSALDVSVQAQIISLIKDLQEELALTYLFISHNLTVVHYISDYIAVMYLGKIVESGPADNVFFNPQHPYTKVLLSSTPSLKRKHRKERILTEGSVPDASNPPSGCAFHPRCPFVMGICSKICPELVRIGEYVDVACHLINK